MTVSYICKSKRPNLSMLVMSHRRTPFSASDQHLESSGTSTSLPRPIIAPLTCS